MERLSDHRALVRTGDSLRITMVPTPMPEEGGVLVACSFVGVCGTDLQILNGTRPDSATILGHEASGVVVEVGRGACFQRGQRVIFNPSAQLSCGRILGHNVQGLFQEYLLVDSGAVNDGLIQGVSAEFPAICGALVEPLGGVVYTHELISHVVPDLRSAIVFGAGPIGLIATEYLRHNGARVLLVHPSQVRLTTAQRLGFIDSSSAMVFSEDLSGRILTWNDGKWFDAAIICTSMAGASQALHHAAEVVRHEGCIEMVTNFSTSSSTPPGISAEDLRKVRAANICGIPTDGAYVFGAIGGRRIAYTSHRGTSREHLERAVRLLQARDQRYTRLITHVLSLSQAADAITTLARIRKASIDGRDCIKAVVNFTFDEPELKAWS